MKQKDRKHERFYFAGLPFYSGDIKGVVEEVSRWIEEGTKSSVFMTNLYSLAVIQRQPRMLRVYQKGLVVPDGMPIVWIAKIMGLYKSQRIYGPDLVLALSKLAQEQKYRVFFYGASKDSLKLFTRSIQKMFPKLVISGTYSPPFRPLSTKESKAIVSKINNTHPHIVFVALTPPAQEAWIDWARRYLNANALINAGAAFDFIGGSKPQAPKWVQAGGLEWLFRLVSEPGRLGKRYWLSAVVLIKMMVLMIVSTGARGKNKARKKVNSN